MLADELDYVVGVDTHLDEHALAVVGAPAGAVVAQRSVRTSAHGYAAAVQFADTHADGTRIWAIEGAGHYGAGLARYLAGRGETVLEVGRVPRDERRLRGKNDPLDAIRAARTALASETLGHCREWESAGMRFGCCCLLAAVQSTCAAKRSCNCAACSLPPPIACASSCADCRWGG